MGDNIRVAGLRLVVENANIFQEALTTNGQVIKMSQTEIEKLTEVYGKNNTSTEYLAKKQQELNKQLDAQSKRVQALVSIRDAYAKQDNASVNTLNKLNLEIGREELAQLKLQNQLQDTTAEIATQEAATQAAAQAQEDARVAAEADAKAQEEAQQSTEQHTEAIEKQRTFLKKLGDGLRQAAKDADVWADKAIKAGDKVSKVGGKATTRVTVPIIGGLTYAAREAIAFEDAFADVEKTVNATDSQLSALSKDLLGLSRILPQTKEEMAAVAALGGQFKVPIENLDEYSKVMLNMGVATNMSATDSAEGMAKFSGIVQMSQDNYERLGSTVVALGNNMRTQEGPIMDMALRLAAAGKQANMTEANIMGISATLSSLGIEAEAGGSAMSKVILDMDMAAAKGGKGLAAFAKVSGMSAADFKKQWNADAAGALTAFIQGLQKVEQNGGNVALTLEKLGYTEVRTRDALLRSVSAGGMFADALTLANTAWAENTALADEAAKKNSTFANRLKTLGNNADYAFQKLGDSAMPIAEDLMTKVSGLVDGFAAMDEEQRKTLLTTVGLTAAFGPAVKGVGLLTQGVGYLGKAFSFLAGPSGWIGLTAIGLSALAYAMVTTKTKAQEMDEALKGIKITVDAASKTAITGAINEGINAANTVHEIKVQAAVDASALQASIDAALADRDITQKEFSAVSKFVTEKINPDIAAAKLALDEKVAAYKQSLDSLVDEQGKALTDEEKDVMLADFEAKNSQLIVDLQREKQNLVDLLAMLQSQKSPITDAQIAQLNEQLEKIAAIREELRIASDEVAAAGRSNYALAVSGQGNEQSAGAAVGYVQQEQALAIAAAEKKKQEALAAAGQDTKLAKQAWDDYNASIAAANATAQEGFQAILDGVAQMAGADMVLKTLAQDYDALKAAISFGDLDYTTLNFTRLKEEWAKQLSSAFGEGGALRNYLTDDQKIKIDDLIAMGGGTHFDYVEVQKIASDLQKQLSDAMVTNAEDPALNPINAIISSMLESGSINSIDPTKLDGAMESIFKLYDAKARGNQIGGDIVAGVPAGIGAAAETLPAESFDKLKDAVLKNLQTAFDSHSPARVVIPVGENVAAGVAVGISNNADTVKGAAEGLQLKATLGLSAMSSIGLSAGGDMMSGLLSGLVAGKPAVLSEASLIAAQIRQLLADAYGYRPTSQEMNFDYSLFNREGYEQALSDEKFSNTPRPAASAAPSPVNIGPALSVGQVIVHKESDAWALVSAADTLRRRQLAGVGALGPRL